MRRTHKCAGSESEKECEHPEKLKHEAEACTDEQVKECHGRLKSIPVSRKGAKRMDLE